MIRQAGVADAVDLARLHATAFPEPWDARAMAALLVATGTLALMSEGGFILIRAAADEAEVLTLAVSPAARRRGLGRALVEAAVDAAYRGGAASLFLEVADDNEAALALYASAGFEPVGRRAGYYHRRQGVAVDALVLRRTLSTAPP